MVALSVSVIMAVLDATRTVAASHLVTTPLRTSWLAVSPDTLGAFETLVRDKVSPMVWDMGIAWVLGLPGFVVFAALAFLFYAMGYRRVRRSGQFAAN
jgi:hypothetical protein